MPGVAPGPALRLPRPRPVRARRAGIASTRTSSLVDPYARALDGKVDCARRFGSTGADERSTSATAPGRAEVRRRRRAFDWGGDRRRRRPVARHRHLRAARQGLHEAAPATSRASCAGRTSASRRRAAIAHLRALGVTTVELMPVHEAWTSAPSPRRGLTNYWGYSTLGFFAPDQRFAARPGDQVREFKEMVRALHAAGHRGHPRRRLQPHLRGRPPRADRVSLRGIDNRTLLPPRGATSSTLRGLHRLRQHAQRDRTRRCSSSSWTACATGSREMHVDGFRFDLAPALGARGARRRSPERLLRHHPPGPRALAREAHRRAVGPRARAATRSATSRSCWTEWNGRFRDTVRRFWRGDKRTIARPRLPPHRLERSLRGRRAAPAREHQLRHRARRLHAARSRQLRDRSTTRRTARRTATGPTTTRAGTAASRARRRTRASASSARARQRNLLATLFLSQGVPMILERRRDRPHAARQQQRVLPGQRALLARLGARRDRARALLAFARALSRLRREHPAFRRIQFFRGARAPGAGRRTSPGCGRTDAR